MADYIVILTMLLDGIYDISFCNRLLTHLRRVGLPLLFFLLKNTIQQGISITSTRSHSFPKKTHVFYHLTYIHIPYHFWLPARSVFRWRVLPSFKSQLPPPFLAQDGVIATVIFTTHDWEWSPYHL